MALVTCPECGKEISNKANACPNCGWSNAPKKARKKIVTWSVTTAVFAVLGIAWAFSINQQILFNKAGTYDITLNGIPIGYTLAAAPAIVLIISIIRIFCKNMKLVPHIVLTAIGIVVPFALHATLSTTGMFAGNTIGSTIITGTVIAFLFQIPATIAARKL